MPWLRSVSTSEIATQAHSIALHATRVGGDVFVSGLFKVETVIAIGDVIGDEP
ncbi:MAG: hypothetical protein WBM50_22525 [Acidimicrobiales bacterium]